ncbi:amylosucrase [Caulobacter sp. Root655]|uniref:alpha-amylase family glycosyl hydrolase n=1 Tax=Caulobacter sp. Root655 TaxID=1736578 RepID=UPI0006FB4844|nr:alpha-amylase family glycosyl hydrolase [Caulobacter sp. Root655]KRA64051.1 amylosucrase [Caulobacter sp. Root655]
MTSPSPSVPPATAPHEKDVERRFLAGWPRLEARLAEVYGEDPRWATFIAALKEKVWAAAIARPPALRALDVQREASQDWLNLPGQGAYTFYVDRFAGDLPGVRERLDYLDDLGVHWLHPLPLLKPRPGDSDGGFAVADYRQIDPRLGDMDDLEALAADLRARDMGLILDVVCNHTAREHAWAQAARAGDPAYREYYITLDAEAAADRERHLIDVFPDTAPGSFTYDPDMGGHVWTTFYPFQWDLNYANPAVFAEMLAVLVFLASKGVQGFRLDSAPYLWKAAGTTSRNQPQAYAIVEAWHEALAIIAPSVVLVAEAIESLDDVLPFFGRDGRGCDLAYNNAVMTALWGALADADAGVFNRCLAASAGKPRRAAWLNYVRCHDDLIWNALAAYASPEDLARWSAFYGQGGGFSHGRAFQTAPGGVPSTNGMAAALAGLEPGEGPHSAGARRLTLLYGIVHALDGWPLIYMGDELGLPNDEAYADDPLRAADGRWLHRPAMDWSAAGRRNQAETLEAELFARFRHFGARARALAAQGVAGPARPVDLGSPAILAFERTEGAQNLLCLGNLAEAPVLATLPAPFSAAARDVLTGQNREGVSIELGPYELVWLVTP